MKSKCGAKPEWIKPGMLVDYHSVIGGPVTQKGMIVIHGPSEMCDHWVVWLKGKSGCVNVEACTPEEY
jgi:hypothetical protein